MSPEITNQQKCQLHPNIVNFSRLLCEYLMKNLPICTSITRAYSHEKEPSRQAYMTEISNKTNFDC